MKLSSFNQTAIVNNSSSIIIGTSILGKPISILQLGTGSRTVLLLSGVHGDEYEGYYFLQTLYTYLTETISESSQRFAQFKELKLHILLYANPDGCQTKRRTNHHNVDLNRNYPTQDWTVNFSNPRYYPGQHQSSEPETIAQIYYLTKYRPHVIISLHSYEKALINYNGRCQQLAQEMSKLNQLPISDNIGYPTPGSLGTYAGMELDIPTITFEFLRKQHQSKTWGEHKDAFLAALQWLNQNPVF